MTKEKQIEEMAKAMCGNGMVNGNCAIDDEPCALECVYGYCAERLYCKGYRKQSEGEWIHEYTGEWLDGTDASLDYKCSLCEELATDPFSYCSHCGAKMKGGE